MSRPIYEPSLARADQALAWGSRQLFRRPAPTAQEGGCDSAYLFFGSFDFTITVPGDGEFENIVDYTSGVSGAFIDAYTNLPGPPGGFEVLRAGIYHINLNTIWDNSFAGGKACRISWSSMGAIQDNFYAQNWVSEQDVDVGVDSVCVSTVLFVSGDPQSSGIVASVAQNSGGDQDLGSVDFSIYKMCDYPTPISESS